MDDIEFDSLRNYWELLRRDPKFRNTLNRIRELINQGKYTEAEKLKKKLKDYDLWACIEILDPDKSFDELRESLGDLGEHLFILHLQSKSARISLENEQGERVPFRADDPTLPPFRYLNIRIDFEEINSIDNFKKALGKFIGDLFGIYKERKSKSVRKPSKLEITLKVGELAERGMTNREIAQELYPKDFSDDSEMGPEGAIDRVKKHKRELKKLMKNGEFKNIRFP